MEISELADSAGLWELMGHLREKRSLIQGVLFRGQSSATWKLVPGLYRNQTPPKSITYDPLAEYNNCVGYSPVEEMRNGYNDAEECMLDSFFSASQLLLPNWKRHPFLDRVIAQHYGVPTVLLDWTLDPLIGSFFATHGIKNEGKCALYYLLPNKVIDDHNQIRFPFREGIARVNPPAVDERVRAQKSVFTLQSWGGEEWYEALDDVHFSADKLFGKVILSYRSSLRIQRELLDMGIDSSLVYPGLAGIGARIASLASMRIYRS